MERKNHKIKLQGYVPLDKLLELNRDALRACPKEERQQVCKALILEVVKWSNYNIEEAIGLLESCQFHFFIEAENKRESEEQNAKVKLR